MTAAGDSTQRRCWRRYIGCWCSCSGAWWQMGWARCIFVAFGMWAAVVRTTVTFAKSTVRKRFLLARSTARCLPALTRLDDVFVRRIFLLRLSLLLRLLLLLIMPRLWRLLLFRPAFSVRGINYAVDIVTCYMRFGRVATSWLNRLRRCLDVDWAPASVPSAASSVM